MKKEKLIRLLSIVCIAIVICLNFMREHYSLDTYSLYGSGFKTYLKCFLGSGRFIAAGIWYVLGSLNIPIKIAISLMGMVSAIILAFSVNILYDKIMQYVEPNKIKKIMIFMLSFVFVFNFMCLQNLVYAESAIMCFGIFCTIKSAIVFNNKNKNSYIYSTLLLTLACASYQGIINIFIPLSILFESLENKEKILGFIKGMCKSLSVYVIAVSSNFILMKIVSNIFLKNGVTRINGEMDILANIFFPFKVFKDIILYSGGMLYKYVFAIFIIVTTIVCVYNIIQNYKKYNILYLVIIILASYFACFIPMLVLSKNALDAPPRLLFSIGSMIPAILIFTIITIKNLKYEKLIIAIIIGWFLINSINFVIVSSDLIETNKKDITETKKIYNLIKDYEEKNNIRVETIKSKYDVNPEFYYKSTLLKNELTLKGNYPSWQGATLINVLNNRNFNYQEMTIKEYENFFGKKDYTSFDKNQIVFEKNIAYWCKY